MGYRNRLKRRLPVILSVIAGILLIAIVAGLLTNWYGFYGPAAVILSSARNTIHSEHFTIEINTSFEHKNSTSPNGTVSTIEVDLDFDNKDLTAAFVNSEGKLTAAIYDGKYIRYRASKDAYFYTDVSDDVAKYFESYQSAGKLDLQEFLTNIGGDELYEKVDDTMYLNRIKKSIFSLYLNFNNESWLTEHAAYSCQSSNGITEYRFAPDLYGLCNTIVGEFQDDFRDEKDYAAVQDKLDGLKKTLDGYDAEMTVGIQDGKLIQAALSVKNSIFDISVAIDVTNIGTSNIDYDALSDILSKSTCKD